MKNKKEQIKDILTRGVEEIFPSKKFLESQLLSEKKLRIKFGIDPTGPRIHIGRALPLWKLRSFQDLGHKIVLIIGDLTAQIGDASDKQALRKTLTENEVKENMKDYINQIGKILDTNKVEFRYNSEWFNKMKITDLISLATNFTAQQMIHRRNFKERWDQKKPIGLHELFYPLFQGYDSVAIKSDIEIGGFDQLFNLKTGRDIQKTFGQNSQGIMTLKMLPGIDGRKMSTSWGNIITIMDSPDEIYGKIMSINDDLILTYFELCTQISLKEIKKITKNLDKNPKEIKMVLAKEITSLYHNKEKAQKAEEEFKNVFQKKGIPSKMPVFNIKKEKINILDLIVNLSLVSSKSEAKRVIGQKGVKINNKIKTDWKEIIDIKSKDVVQVGKKKFAKIL